LRDVPRVALERPGALERACWVGAVDSFFGVEIAGVALRLSLSVETVVPRSRRLS